MGQWFNITIYSVITIWFVGSFVQRHNYNFRRSLFMSYGLSFAILLIYILYMLIFDDSVDNIVDRTCDLVTDTRINWKNCNDFLSDFFWLFMGIYLIFYVLIKLYFVRILYYYAKEIENENAEDRRYSKLDGETNE